jgi:hypothetical protein
MSCTEDHARSPRRRRAASGDASALDEACFMAELRLAVEGARTAAEERLARRLPGWRDRLDQVCRRLAR